MTQATHPLTIPATSERRLANLALLGVAWFAAGVMMLHLLRGDLSPATHMVSEYALGRLGWIQTANFLALATGCVALARAAHLSRAPLARATPVLVGVFAATTYLSALFEAGTGTWQGQVHEIVGVLGFLALMVAALATAFSLRGQPWRPLRRQSQLWGAAMVVTFPLVPLLGPTGMGIGQRLFIACALAWLATLAIGLRRAARNTATT